MRKFIFQTSEFERIDKSRWPQFVKDFLENPDVNAIHSYNHSKIFFRKYNTNQYPRIMFLEEVRNDVALYIPRLYFKHHDEYTQFLTLGEREMIKKGKYSPSEIEEIEAEFKKYEEPDLLPDLPDSMRDIERKRDFSNIETSFVFEMEEWVRNIKSPEFADDRRSIHTLLQNIIVDKNYDEADEDGWITMSFQNNKSIILRISNLDDHTYFYLFDISSNIDKKALSQKYLLDVSDTVLLKKARKGYPDWIVCGDFEDWIKLENDEEANLALSDEEVRVLNETPYPYFVNGLAGSGKSTILYYLFAHAYAYRQVHNQSLLFLSYSKKLVKKAQTVVLALLRTNPSYSGYSITPEEEKTLSECFSPFIDFLKEHFLTTPEEFKRFDKDKHISFERFQRLYKGTDKKEGSEKPCNLVEANSYSATIVWSVIRSFIKGRDHNKFFTTEDYRAIQRDDRTVVTTDYEKIEKIFRNWYLPLSEKYWDDLDLVRYVLKKIDENPSCFNRYDIIYCDEAQDFTPIENKLVLKLSSYTQYNLSGYKKIPVAYAGDPNQTVSPTGFSWKRLKDVFSKSYEDQIGGFISLKDKTLNNNYRSKRTIVEFANSIQYIRKCYLTDESLLPQEQWNPQANPLPGFFFIDSEEDKNFIKKGFEKTECIITGAEGEYEKELDKDELTPDSTKIDDDFLMSINKTKLYTAISSKGLEFKAVILYRFADFLPSSFSKLLNGSPIEETEKYELAHFFTKLYIAVSRAREILYIIDSKENYDKFWSCFIENQYVLNLLNSRQDVDSWKDKIGGIVMGDKSEFISRLDENFNPLELAFSIFNDAKYSQESKDMNRAVGYFEEASSFENAELARAYVLLFEQQYSLSGDKFNALHHTSEAIDAYWKGACWSKLLNITENIQYKLAAQFMNGDKSLIDFLIIDGIMKEIKYKDETWRKVVLKMQTEANMAAEDDIYTICEKFEILVEKGYKFLNDTIATLYFQNKKYSAAIRKWEELGKLDHKDYYEAKEFTADKTPEKIYWKYKGGKNKELLDAYSTPKDAELYNFDERAIGIMFSLLLSANKFKEALAYPYEKEDKYRRLYSSDRMKFLQYCVLKEKSLDYEKFIEFVETKAKDGITEIFEQAWPQETVQVMFESTYMADKNRKEFGAWLNFMKLRDSNHYRLMKNEENVNVVLKGIAGILACEDMVPENSTLAQKNEEKKRRLSCFLDFLFDGHYNYPRAKQYDKELVAAIKDTPLYRTDFSESKAENEYFVSCELDARDYDQIKDNIREYSERAIKETKKLKNAADEERFYLLCNLYEKVIPYTKDKNEKSVPDFSSIDRFYEKMKKDVKDGKLKDSENAAKILNARLVFNNLRSENRFALKTWLDKIEQKHVSPSLLISTFDKENSVMFLKKALKNKTFDASLLKDWINPISEKIYETDVRTSDFGAQSGISLAARKNVLSNLIAIADYGIDKLLDEKDVDSYHIKLLTYIWEYFFEVDDSEDKRAKKDDKEKVKMIAEKFDALIKDSRIENSYSLLQYLKSRALSYYANISSAKYKEKTDEYGIYKSIDDMKSAHRRPNILKDSETSESKMQEVLLTVDTEINGVVVEFKSSKRIIWFSRDGNELATITKGVIEVSEGADVKIKGSQLSIGQDFLVIVNSEKEVVILSKGVKYKIKF